MLVFKNEELDKLNIRIGELKQNLADLQAKLKELEKQIGALKKDKELKRARVRVFL